MMKMSSSIDPQCLGTTHNKKGERKVEIVVGNGNILRSGQRRENHRGRNNNPPTKIQGKEGRGQELFFSGRSGKSYLS